VFCVFRFLLCSLTISYYCFVGAKQFNISTVLGIPIPSPSAGRIVVLFYSKEDRPRDLKLVNRISELITKVRY
jgi:hypothetical protein